MPARAETDSPRFVVLDGLRGVAAISVLLMHFTMRTAFPTLRMGYFAVDLFFCLSGFVLAHTYSVRLAAGMSASDFMLRRLIRLYPLYVVGLMLGFAALALKTAVGLSDYAAGDLFASLRDNLLFLPYFNAHRVASFGYTVRGELFPSNPAAWSLFFELAANVAFARFANLSLRALVGVVLVSLVAYFFALMLLAAQPGWGAQNFWGGIPRVTFGFFAGVLAHEAWRGAPLGSALPGRRAFAVTIGIAALIVALFMQPFALAYPCALLLAPLIVFVAARVDVGERLAALCTALGWLSYPIYCLHGPIYGLVEASCAALGNPRTGSPAVFIVAVVVTLMASIVLTRMFEEPTRAWLSARLGGGRGMFKRMAFDKAAERRGEAPSDETTQRPQYARPQDASLPARHDGAEKKPRAAA
jgi:peptidoglycan/LPS O-acetylase OafA/YrhL